MATISPLELPIVITPNEVLNGNAPEPQLVNFVEVPPQQVAGFVPFKHCCTDEVNLLDCEDDCREDCTYKITVFGQANAKGASYENDVSFFLFNDAKHNALPTSTFKFYLEKYVDNEWLELSELVDETYGEDYPFGSFTSQRAYRGFMLNWGKVIQWHGEGCYRIKIKSEWTDATQGTATTTFTTVDPGGDLNWDVIGVTFDNGAEIKINTVEGKAPSEMEALLNSDEDILAQGVEGFNITRGGGNIMVEGISRRENNIQSIEILSGPENTPPPSGTTIPFDTETYSTTSETFTHCLTSETFELIEWNCERADRTVKFEAFIEGKIGDNKKDHLIYDLCDVPYYDSIRVGGYFGNDESEYETVQLEHGKPLHGKIEKIRDEEIQIYNFFSHALPKFIHDRLRTYGMMADELRISDYNTLNGDYDLKRVKVVRDSSYSPEYYTKEGSRLSSVKIKFKRGVQSIIKSICC